MSTNGVRGRAARSRAPLSSVAPTKTFCVADRSRTMPHISSSRPPLALGLAGTCPQSCGNDRPPHFTDFFFLFSMLSLTQFETVWHPHGQPVAAL